MMRNNLPSLREPGFGLSRGCKVALYFLAVLSLCLWLEPATFAYPQKEKTNDAQRGTSSIAGNVNVSTGEGQVNNLAGITVKLIDPKTGSALQSTLADESGHFQFTQLVAGTYTLEVSAEGFKAWVKTVTLGQGQATAEDVTLEINSVEEKIEVQAENIEISTHSAEATGEFGVFSGGLREIEPNPPFDAWNYKLHDFIPGIRGKGGHLQGIADFTPRLEFGGRLVDRKFNVTEELAWDMTNQPVRG